MLDQKRLKEVFQYDPSTGLFCRIKSIRGQRAGILDRSPKANGYISVRLDGKEYFAHRLAWLYMRGRWPIGVIDHINGTRSDNRFSNLRECTRSQNSCNSPSRKGKLKGAFWSKQIKRWFSAISFQKTQHYLGTFDSELEAHEAYKEAAIKLHGEFANAAASRPSQSAKRRALVMDKGVE